LRVEFPGEQAVGGLTAGEPSVRNLWPPLPGDASGHVTVPGVLSLIPGGITPRRSTIDTKREARNRMSILWIILIVILVLALLGFFSRGRW
jgi:hypothetical protein